ncbi:hypothetical protein [Clostridium sp.]|uniref:hypothetical protein n=1 Tax=Clostridium sp. TaxID=1506 RepID=UPI0026397C20|nr:hypothetical protein [Clostridium sp.]
MKNEVLIYFFYGEDIFRINKEIEKIKSAVLKKEQFDFNFDRKLTDEEIEKLEEVVNGKIKEDLPVHFEIMP